MLLEEKFYVEIRVLMQLYSAYQEVALIYEHQNCAGGNMARVECHVLCGVGQWGGELRMPAVYPNCAHLSPLMPAG